MKSKIDDLPVYREELLIKVKERMINLEQHLFNEFILIITNQNLMEKDIIII